MKVLLIDPDTETANTLSLSFKLGWTQSMIVRVEEGTRGLAMAETESPHLIIVEVNLPDIDGFEVVSQIRLFSDVPIVILTEREGELDTVRGLEMGADDYVIKPFNPLDLLARVRAILRRSGMFSNDDNGLKPFVSANLHVDFSCREVFLDGSPVHLTPTEYKVLHQLVRNSGRLVTIQMLKQQVWGDGDFVDSGTVRKCVCQLRHKLHDSSDRPHMILNERGIGYKLMKTRQTDLVASR